MKGRCFRVLSDEQVRRGNRLCVGLDIPTIMEKFPPSTACDSVLETLTSFTCNIVDATCRLNIAAYKPNFWFWAPYFPDGLEALQQVNAYIHKVAPEIPVILDIKIPDIGKTNQAAMALVKRLYVDAITAHCYLGRTAHEVPEILGDETIGVFILDRTSNPGADEFQGLLVRNPTQPEIPEMELYKRVAYNVTHQWTGLSKATLGFVAGATWPREISEIRQIVGPAAKLLIPGVGGQGGKAEDAVVRGGDNIVINVSSKIIGASSGDDYAQAAADAALGYIKEINEAIASLRQE